MQIREGDSAVTTITATEEAAPVAGSKYEAVRYNAMKHGILSRLTVLAHEDAGEFDGLLAALVEEHQPVGLTERHLIEELASIIWRKRRVLLAEGAAIHRGLNSVVHSPFDSPIPAAAPFVDSLSDTSEDLPDLLTASPEEIAERQRNAAPQFLKHSAPLDNSPPKPNRSGAHTTTPCRGDGSLCDYRRDNFLNGGDHG